MATVISFNLATLPDDKTSTCFYTEWVWTNSQALTVIQFIGKSKHLATYPQLNCIVECTEKDETIDRVTYQFWINITSVH